VAADHRKNMPESWTWEEVSNDYREGLFFAAQGVFANPLC